MFMIISVFLSSYFKAPLPKAGQVRENILKKKKKKKTDYFEKVCQRSP